MLNHKLLPVTLPRLIRQNTKNIITIMLKGTTLWKHQ